MNKRYGKILYAIELITRSLPCFTQLHSLFYVNGVKIKPPTEVLYNLLTPIALAHLIMGDGCKYSRGLIICTDSYTVEDVVKLMNVLIIRYRLDCTLRLDRPNKPRIYIRERSMTTLRSIVIPYMHSSMLYKLRI